MNPITRIPKSGTTITRKEFFDQVTDVVIQLRKRPGKNVSVDEFPGYGSIVSIPQDERGRQGSGSGSGPTTCPNCNDLPPTNPSGHPTHINVQRTLSGTCPSGLVFSGTIAYDLDLGFGLIGPIGGHNFCGHNIFDNGFGAFWTGTYTKTCGATSANFGGNGTGGLLGRDVTDCSWWFQLDPPTGIGLGIGTCGNCTITFSSIFQMIAGAGDPAGTYMFSETDNGVTLDTTVVIT